MLNNIHFNFRKNNKRLYKGWSLKHHYGISIEVYDEIFKKQQGLCAICSKPESMIDVREGTVQSLSIDHDHLTGKIRGLLCNACNRGLGYFKDNPEFLVKAAAYLKIA